MYLGRDRAAQGIVVMVAMAACAIGSAAWAGGPRPDLSPISLSVSPSQSTLGTELTATVVVGNLGDAAVGDFRLDLWEHRASEPGSFTDSDHSWLIPGLAAGAAAARVYTFTPASAGVYHAWAWADSLEVVLEHNEDNNKLMRGYAVNEEGELPDLTVDGLEVSPDQSTLGEQLRAYVCLWNRGDGNAGDFWLLFWEHRDFEPGTPANPDALWHVRGLAAGEAPEYTDYTFMPVAPGLFRAWAWADGVDAVEESNESNNKRDATYAVNQAGELPDLVIDALSVEPDPSALGTELTVQVTVANGGAGHSPAFATSFWAHRGTEPPDDSDQTSWWWHPDGLAPGHSMTRDDTFTPVAPGDLQAWAWVDPGDSVAESNESNNKGSDSYTVLGPPDLVIESILVWPNPSVLGTELTLTVRERNVGETVAPPHRLAAWRHRVSEPAPAAAGDYNWDIPSATAGQMWQRTATFTPGFPGSRTARALTDANGEIDEAAEGNNTGSCEYTILRDLPDLVVSSLAMVPNPCTLGQQVAAEVKVRNDGAADASAFRIALWWHRAGPPVFPASGDRNWDVAGLAPGAEVTRPAGATPSFPGDRTAWASADALRQVNEAEEGNNVASCPYSISSEGLPDLVVESFTVTPNPITLGGDMTLTLIGRNAGPGAVGPFHMTAWRHRAAPPVFGTTGDHEWSVPGLAEGASATRSATYTPQYLGARRAFALVDNLKEIPEGNEANNARYCDYYIVSGPLADLVIDWLTVTPDVSALGTELILTIHFSNAGPVDAGPFKLRLWFHRLTPPVVGSSGANQSWDVSGLASGVFSVASASCTPGYPGDRTAHALVDALNEVPEANETNNTAVTAYTINATGGAGAGRPSRPQLE